jgi:ABC-type antimicrobial peptide transport system permease subunit
MPEKNVLLDTVPNSGASEEDIARENQMTWAAFNNGTKLLNKQGEEKPFVITSNYLAVSIEGMGLSPVDESIWLQDENGALVEFVVGAITSFMSPIEQAYYSISVTLFSDPNYGVATLYIPEEYANGLAFYPSGLSNASNMFLIKTSGLLDAQMNEDIAKAIESTANSATGSFRQAHGMYGVIGLPLWEVFEFQMEMQYRMFKFMQIFTSLGFIVGITGLLVVSVRSVSERKREIGMMRAIGFTRSNMILAILTELLVMGFIGLIVGLINGSLLGWALTNIGGGGTAKFLIPWSTIGLYTFITFAAAVVAAIIPGWKAANIPPSEALRYVG